MARCLQTPTLSSSRGCGRAPPRPSASSTRSARASAAAIDLTAALTVNTSQPVPLTVRLRGPADVIGIDQHEIVRMDPRPGTADFEPNYFAAIEFDRPDFPWLFTPARADTLGAAAALALPGGRPRAGGRDAAQHQRRAVAFARDRRAGAVRRGAA